MPEGALRAAGAHDHADGRTANRALRLGASGRGATRAGNSVAFREFDG